MRFVTALRLGLRGARRRPGLIVIAWLAALLPALLLVGMLRSDLAAAMDESPFAGQALASVLPKPFSPSMLREHMRRAITEIRD